MDPSSVLAIVDSPVLAEVGAEVGAKLRRVVDACRG
jgi:hypothetical protein